MIDFDLFSFFCNDTNHSSTQIWIDNDISPCYRKFLFGSLQHTILLIFLVYQTFQRSSCSYRLWSISLIVIRFGSVVLLLTTFSSSYYYYFFHEPLEIQRIDFVNCLLILVTYLSMNHLNLNKNLYHPSRPWIYLLVTISFFLLGNYDIYRISINHVSSIDTIYICLRQSCLGLICLALFPICCHRCGETSMPTLSSFLRIIELSGK